MPIILRPRQDSNLRSWLRRPLLYPLSYEGGLRMYRVEQIAPHQHRLQNAIISRFGSTGLQRYSQDCPIVTMMTGLHCDL